MLHRDTVVRNHICAGIRIEEQIGESIEDVTVDVTVGKFLVEDAIVPVLLADDLGEHRIRLIPAADDRDACCRCFHDRQTPSFGLAREHDQIGHLIDVDDVDVLGERRMTLPPSGERQEDPAADVRRQPVERGPV